MTKMSIYCSQCHFVLYEGKEGQCTIFCTGLGRSVPMSSSSIEKAKAVLEVSKGNLVSPPINTEFFKIFFICWSTFC